MAYPYDNNYGYSYPPQQYSSPGIDSAQQRLNAIQGYPSQTPSSYYPPSYYSRPYSQSPSPTSNQIICRPVTGIKEVESDRIDAFNTYLYPSFSENKIYLKQIANDGSAMYVTFAPERQQEVITAVTPVQTNQVQAPQQQLTPQMDYVSKIAELEQRIYTLENELKGAITNEQSLSTVQSATDTEQPKRNKSGQFVPAAATAVPTAAA